MPESFTGLCDRCLPAYAIEQGFASPARHARVRRELSALLDTMRSLAQHIPTKNGEYWETDETLGGDITGMTNAPESA